MARGFIALACLLTLASTGAARETPLYGLVTEGQLTTTSLARLDPATLRPRPGRKVDVFNSVAPSFSPDRSRLVLGGGDVVGLSFVDLRRMQVLGHFFENAGGFIAATAWPARKRVLALVGRYRVGDDFRDCCAGYTLLTLDPATRRVLRRVRLADVQAHARTRDGLVLVIAPVGRIGPTRLAVSDAEGRIRSVALERIAGGREPGSTEDRVKQPALAVDAARGRALVVSADDPVAEVDLRTLRVAYHELAGRALQKRPLVGPRERARWLGGGVIAVQGTTGLRLVDAGDWTQRRLESRWNVAWLGDDMIVTAETIGTGTGVRSVTTAYGRDGAIRFRTESDSVTWWMQGAQGRLYIAQQLPAGPFSYAVVELATGRRAEFRGSMPILLPDD